MNTSEERSIVDDFVTEIGATAMVKIECLSAVLISYFGFENVLYGYDVLNMTTKN
jgi:hypothetical protein